jgi:nitrogen-specific signal transduction histidine kinase
MTLIETALLVTFFIDLLLGVVVYFTNTGRSANQLFFFLAFHMALWTLCVLLIMESTQAVQARHWIRTAFMVTALFPGSMATLHLAIKYPGEHVHRLFLRAGAFWMAGILAALFCMSNYFMHGIVMPATPYRYQVPEAMYGPGFILFVGYFLLACAVAGWRFLRDLRHAEGIQRAEFQFVLLGFSISVLIGTTFSLIIPLVTGASASSRYGPLSTVALTLIIAYGIAKYRIMDVTQLLRRSIALALLIIGLAMLYTAVWTLSSQALYLLGIHVSFIPNLLAALVTAFSMAPAHGWLQSFSRHLTFDKPDIDPSETIQQASRILHSITTLPELLELFCATITGATGARHIALLLHENEQYVQKYPLRHGHTPVLKLGEADPLVRRLRTQPEAVVADTLRRHRSTPQRRQLAEKLAGLKSAIVLGIRLRGRLNGIMLLGPRESGSIYGDIEQRTLQLLCDQLAVAIENSKLYTEARNREIYNKILLDSLVSGVIAANDKAAITVCNSEARRIIGMHAPQVIYQPVEVLPDILAKILRHTLKTGHSCRDIESTLTRDEEQIPICVGSAIFKDDADQTMGALLVFSDQTRIKKLEMQVRRTDRLASVGTLSAGMAHEIKNPLVSIKTFSQLLPERYSDPDFRETFASLLTEEVKRIDSIVNQLLHFARPARPELKPCSLHEILDNSIRLVDQPLQQKGIQLTRDFQAAKDIIQADSGQLDQAFINFFLNAIDAMDTSGTLTVRTRITRNPWETVAPFGQNGTQYIQVAVSDTGKGIPQEDLTSVFDPFFTTKTNGTGLGLSVAHGIIHEHRGSIDVRSIQHRGTTFTIVFPLAAEDAAP